jgi:FimV-like protein
MMRSKKLFVCFVLILGWLPLSLVFAQTSSSTPAIEIYGPIKSGDLLWDIALKLRPNDSVSRYQTMQAILAANPQAFSVECNSNSPLKTGELLRIPTLQEVQKLSATEARRQFSEQAEQWRNARKNGTEIQCPASSVASLRVTPSEASVTAEVVINQAVIPTLLPAARSEQRPPLSPILSPSTPPQRVVTHTAPETETQPIVTEEEYIKPPVINPAPVDVAPSEVSYLTWLEHSALFAELKNSMPQLPLWIILMVLGLLFVIVALLLVLILMLLKRVKSSTSSSPQYPIDSLKPFTPSNEIPPKMSTAVWGELPIKKSEPSRPPHAENSPPYAFIEQQLAHIRTCLATEGETQAVRVLLHDVMTRGTQQQQAQAEQLLEIARKMHWLEERTPRQTDETTENKSTQQTTTDDYFPLQRYLPEEQARIFEIIDRIFGLLDQELSANGKLVEAYINRHQRENFWDSRQYKVIDKVQSPLVDPEPIPDNKSRDPKTPPRHL